jgi:hypothetical protein
MLIERMCELITHVLEVLLQLELFEQKGVPFALQRAQQLRHGGGIEATRTLHSTHLHHDEVIYGHWTTSDGACSRGLYVLLD